MSENKISIIKNHTNINTFISEILGNLHIHGPESSDILETISLIKEFRQKEFTLFEEQIITALGLFYKLQKPNTLYSLLFSSLGETYERVYGKKFTPVQANLRHALNTNKFISISAPTSAGKSYSIRDFIQEQNGDAVIVVPSRALIAEFIASLRNDLDGDKSVMILSFVEDIFKSRDLKRIFVLTPERARDLFDTRFNLDIKVIFFDEAQISEESKRGFIFDSLVRRISNKYPLAKLIFAHPFIENPEAQFHKHDLVSDSSYSYSYRYGATGRISVFQHNNGKDYYFSPNINKGHLIKNCEPFEDGFENFAFNGKNSILIYVSKASIYNNSFLNDFQKHINNYPNINDIKAIKIIDDIKDILGVDGHDHVSKLVSLLYKGVVIHHGSIPLDVRFLLEKFIRDGFARICFATSTLAQGINMPFDIVWLQNMRMIGDSDRERSLSFKNLIGRAGRLTKNDVFDYGYVFTKNPELYSQRLNEKFYLSNESIIDSNIDLFSDDELEFVRSLKENDFNIEHNLPEPKVQRLSSSEVIKKCLDVINYIYDSNGSLLKITGEENSSVKDEIKKCLAFIFEKSINRKMKDGEVSVFRQAISIFILSISGKSFKEIVGIRYTYISNRDQQKSGQAKFSQPASYIPDSSLEKSFPLFINTLASDVNYDAIIFDTYDYFDQVISYALKDIFIAAFKICLEISGDPRCRKIIELFRFGTNDVNNILLLRYGFSPEIINDIIPYIISVNENNIIFSKNIDSAPDYIKDSAAWYLP